MLTKVLFVLVIPSYCFQYIYLHIFKKELPRSEQERIKRPNETFIKPCAALLIKMWFVD